MWNEVEHRFERGDGALRRTGQIHDKSVTAGSGGGAAERGQRSAADSSGAHALGEAIEDAGADSARGLRCDIARRDAGATSGDDECGICGVFAQGCFNFGLLVRDEMWAFQEETG